MDQKEEFKKILESMRDEKNTPIIDKIKEGFDKCFEGEESSGVRTVPENLELAWNFAVEYKKRMREINETIDRVIEITEEMEKLKVNPNAIKHFRDEIDSWNERKESLALTEKLIDSATDMLLKEY